MTGIIHPTTTQHIGFGFGSTSFAAYDDRTWHGIFITNFHGGIDYWGPLDYPILACANGIVKYAGYAVPYIGSAGGNGIVIQHGPNMKSIYGHMNSISVSPGQAVVQGQKIGGIGQSGIANGVIHLHFEIRTITAAWGEDVEDPAVFLPGGAQYGTAFGQDFGDIPWLEPLAGKLIKAALCNPAGTNQWRAPTAADTITAVYADRVLVPPANYVVDGDLITFIEDTNHQIEVRADYTSG